MSTSLVSNFVEEVKGGRRSGATFSHNSTGLDIKLQLKLLLNQLYCSFPALTQRQ